MEGFSQIQDSPYWTPLVSAGNLTQALKGPVAVTAMSGVKVLAPSWARPVAFAVQMPANAYELESSQQSARRELSRLKSTRERQGPEVWRGLFDLYEVLEAYAPRVVFV